MNDVRLTNSVRKSIIPVLIGVLVSSILYLFFHWWVFLVIFPWIGLSVSVGLYLRMVLKGKNQLIGRKISLLMIWPCLFLFIPIINNENFQLEGVALIVLVGFFSKGFIHYCVAKIFGPLIWRRGFCGYACWTAAILEWLPVEGTKRVIDEKYRNLRYISLAISVAIPLYLIFVLSYDPLTNYVNVFEMKWMFISNGVYYAIAIPLAFVIKDRRAFCKYLCPVALIMKPTSSIGLIQVKANTLSHCVQCGECNRICPMGINVMDYMLKKKDITTTECILCNDCKIVCNRKMIL